MRWLRNSIEMDFGQWGHDPAPLEKSGIFAEALTEMAQHQR